MLFRSGDAGEMVLRELNNNPEWNCLAVGFLDDDPLKKDKVIHGLRVYDGNGTLAEICREKGVSEILISARDMSGERLKKLRELCREENILLKKAQFKIEPVDLI